MYAAYKAFKISPRSSFEMTPFLFSEFMNASQFNGANQFYP
jgi:hypothetical protein